MLVFYFIILLTIHINTSISRSININSTNCFQYLHLKNISHLQLTKDNIIVSFNESWLATVSFDTKIKHVIYLSNLHKECPQQHCSNKFQVFASHSYNNNVLMCFSYQKILKCEWLNTTDHIQIISNKTLPSISKHYINTKNTLLSLVTNNNDVYLAVHSSQNFPNIIKNDVGYTTIKNIFKNKIRIPFVVQFIGMFETDQFVYIVFNELVNKQTHKTVSV